MLDLPEKKYLSLNELSIRWEVEEDLVKHYVDEYGLRLAFRRKNNQHFYFRYVNDETTSDEIVIRALFLPTSTSFYSNGQIKEKGSFLSQEKHGLWRTYKEDGELESVKCFNRGMSINVSKCA